MSPRTQAQASLFDKCLYPLNHLIFSVMLAFNKFTKFHLQFILPIEEWILFVRWVHIYFFKIMGSFLHTISQFTCWKLSFLCPCHLLVQIQMHGWQYLEKIFGSITAKICISSFTTLNLSSSSVAHANYVSITIHQLVSPSLLHLW